MHTLAATREYYWILHGHAAVKRVVGRCTVCRRTFARPGTQIMAPLPNFRVSPGKPAFTCVGLDFAGPFVTKSGRSLTKRYLCIFTCLASRAVHLEVAFGLDSDSFLQCFSRFCNRRLTPELLVSDNCSNFVEQSVSLGMVSAAVPPTSSCPSLQERELIGDSILQEQAILVESGSASYGRFDGYFLPSFKIHVLMIRP